jgi:hypothetical protein
MKRLSSLTGLNLNSIEAIGLDVAKEKIDICLFSSQQSLFYRIANNSQAICQFSTDLTTTVQIKKINNRKIRVISTDFSVNTVYWTA